MTLAISEIEFINSRCDMSKKYKLEISPALLNLLFLEILFLGVAICLGLYLWVGMPTLTSYPQVYYICSAMIMLLLSTAALFRLSSFVMKLPVTLLHNFIPLVMAVALMLILDSWQAEFNFDGGNISSIFICSWLGMVIYRIIKTKKTRQDLQD